MKTSSSIIKLLLLFLCVIGFANSLFMNGLHAFGDLACFGKASCNVVLNSEYASIFGIRWSHIGILFYSFLSINILLYAVERQAIGLYLFAGASLAGVLCSLYLTGLQAWIIHAWCPFCLASAIIQCIMLISAVLLIRLEHMQPNRLCERTTHIHIVASYYAVAALGLLAFLWAQPILLQGLKEWKQSDDLVASFAHNKTYLADIRDPGLHMFLYEIEKARYDELRDWYESELLQPFAKANGHSNIDDWVVDEIETNYKTITPEELEVFYREQYYGDEPLEKVKPAIFYRIIEERYENVYYELVKKIEVQQKAKFNVLEPTVPIYDMPVDLSSMPLLGDPNAPIQIVEFSDFECPFCREAFYLLKSWQERYPDKVCIVFRHNPLDNNKHASGAARASIAAYKQGKFWEYADKLYSNQSNLNDNTYIAIAKELGLSIQAFNRDMNSPETAAILERELKASDEYYISSVPTLFIGGQLVDKSIRPSDELLKPYISDL